MKHAIMILAHGNFKILSLLLGALDDERFDIYVHVDARAAFDRAALDGVCRRARVTFVPRRHVRWGGWSQTKATVELMRAAAGTPHDYYHLISGVDLPLVSADEFDAYFEGLGGGIPLHYVTPKDFQKSARTHWILIDSFLSDMPWLARLIPGRRRAWRDVLYELDHKVTAWPQRLLGVDRLKKLPFELAHGPNWVDLPEDAMKYVLSRSDEYLAYSKRTFASDERFVCTLIRNSPFYDRVIFLDEARTKTPLMRYWIWHSSGPITLTSAHYDGMRASGKFWARKFDENVDLAVAERISGEIRAQNELNRQVRKT